MSETLPKPLSPEEQPTLTLVDAPNVTDVVVIPFPNAIEKDKESLASVREELSALPLIIDEQTEEKETGKEPTKQQETAAKLQGYLNALEIYKYGASLLERQRQGNNQQEEKPVSFSPAASGVTERVKRSIDDPKERNKAESALLERLHDAIRTNDVDTLDELKQTLRGEYDDYRHIISRISPAIETAQIEVLETASDISIKDSQLIVLRTAKQLGNMSDEKRELVFKEAGIDYEVVKDKLSKLKKSATLNAKWTGSAEVVAWIAAIGATVQFRDHIGVVTDPEMLKKYAISLGIYHGSEILTWIVNSIALEDDKVEYSPNVVQDLAHHLGDMVLPKNKAGTVARVTGETAAGFGFAAAQEMFWNTVGLVLSAPAGIAGNAVGTAFNTAKAGTVLYNKIKNGNGFRLKNKEEISSDEKENSTTTLPSDPEPTFESDK